jgi:hypothetical protein
MEIAKPYYEQSINTIDDDEGGQHMTNAHLKQPETT